MANNYYVIASNGGAHLIENVSKIHEEEQGALQMWREGETMPCAAFYSPIGFFLDSGNEFAIDND